MTFDHMDLIAGEPREMGRLRAALLTYRPGAVLQLSVQHELDGSCCRREPWGKTFSRILLALELPGRELPPGTANE